MLTDFHDFKQHSTNKPLQPLNPPDILLSLGSRVRRKRFTLVGRGTPACGELR